jgi:hypothetical protein
MLHRTSIRRRRISNSLAIFGAFLIAASVLAGGDHAPQEADRHADTGGQAAEWLTEAESTVLPSANSKTRRFRVNLFLFRH